MIVITPSGQLAAEYGNVAYVIESIHPGWGFITIQKI